MPALNSRVGRRREENNSNNGSGIGQAVLNNINFTNLFAAVFSILSLKERWETHKDNRQEAELRRNLLARGVDPHSVNNRNSQFVQYRDNPSSENIGLTEENLQTNNNGIVTEPLPLVSEDLRPIRQKKSSCCVCFGIRCDIVFKAIGIVLVLYFCYGIFKVYKWATTPSPTGLEDMPEYSTSLGCLSAPFMYPKNSFSTASVTNETRFVMDIIGGAVGTILLTRGDSSGVIVKMSLVTDEQPLLEKSTALVQEESSDAVFSLSTPFASISEDACMRFDLIVQIPRELRMLSLKSQSIVHVKYDDQAPLSLTDVEIDLSSRSSDNLLLPNTEIDADKITFTMRGGYVVGSFAFKDEARISSYGDAITNLHVSPLSISKHLTGPANLVTSGGNGRTNIIYSNPEGRVISSSHSSSQGDMYLTYRDAGYNGPITVQAKSTTSTNVQRDAQRMPGAGGKSEMWVGDKEGDDRLNVKTSGWVGLYF